MTANVVLGLGNVLMGDDGAGVHTVERLKSESDLSERASLIDGGTLSFSLLDTVESAERLIVVDAMQLDSLPGTVRTFVDDELDEFLGAPAQRSIHDVNLGDLLRMCALRGTLPRHRALVGIQPERIQWGDSPGCAVSRGIEQACEVVDRLIEAWSRDDE